MLNFFRNRKSLFLGFPRFNFSTTIDVPLDFKPQKSGDTNRSQRGIFQGKQHHYGFRKCFSMKHERRTFKVNVHRKTYFSHILNRKLYVWVSMKALRTITKYGSFDNYILKYEWKSIRTSKFAVYMRNILKAKLNDPEVQFTKIACTKKPKSSRMRLPLSEYRGLASVYMPPETKTRDLTDMFYPDFETRESKEYKANLVRELESTVDLKRRNEVLQKLKATEKDDSLKNEMLALLPLRHKLIRDTFVRIKYRADAKLHFLQTLEHSEDFTKKILGNEYKHFSVDYPEVQLILNLTESEKIVKRKNEARKYKISEHNMGTLYTNKNTDMVFDPFTKKTGKLYNLKKKPSEVNAKVDYVDLHWVERKILKSKIKQEKTRARKIRVIEPQVKI